MIRISARDNMNKKDDYNSKVLVFDFDGTIANHAEYPEIGSPIKKTIDKLKEFKDKGYGIIISSCRFSERINGKKEAKRQLKQVKEWLDENEIPFDELWEDAKPGGLCYIDDRGMNVKDINKLDEKLLNSFKV